MKTIKIKAITKYKYNDCIKIYLINYTKIAFYIKNYILFIDKANRNKLKIKGKNWNRDETELISWFWNFNVL